MKPSAGTMRHSPPPPKTPSELAPFIDHTLLRADATERMIETLCREAVEHRFFAVCVNSGHVAHAHRILESLAKSQTGGHRVAIAAVIGFPLGACSTAAKVFETKDVIAHGATEIDMVVRVDLVKTGEFTRMRDDVRAVVEAARDRSIVKVILETGLLTLEEISRSARACDEGGAQFVKTCTGFSTAGSPAGAATVEHVALMKESIREHMQVKASGGIRSFETARGLILAGADRLGTSSGVALVSGAATGGGY